VVAGGDNRLTTLGRQLHKKIIVLFCGLVGRIALVKDVPGHQQVINFIFPNVPEQPVQEQGHVLAEVLHVQFLPKVPVCCDQYFHRFLLVLLQYQSNG
jgi:hypothetical protein